MGQEEYQSHRFPCTNCGEEMVVALRVDFVGHGYRTEAVENTKHALELPDAPIVNVDANFIVPKDERHKDFAFPRLTQLHAMMDAAEKAGSLVAHSAIPNGMLGQRPFRRPDYADEWKLLKKAWSLHRRGHYKLSRRRVEDATGRLYAADPLRDLLDWLWRFTLFIGQPAFEPKFRAAFDVVKPLIPTPGFDDFVAHYNNLASERGGSYFDLMNAYFSAFSEYGQVHFHVSRSLDVPDGNVASSIDFGATQMFYGNAFEAFASSVDVLAYLNNLATGRAFDKFQTLTHDEYLKLDKAARFNTFSLTPAFAALCEESDNRLRNASHHGGFQFDPATQVITFRAGKGGTGPEQKLGYAMYLARCSKLFLQSMTLLRIEILICHATGAKPPL